LLSASSFPPDQKLINTVVQEWKENNGPSNNSTFNNIVNLNVDEDQSLKIVELFEKEKEQRMAKHQRHHT
jgi:hypothetical protein